MTIHPDKCLKNIHLGLLHSERVSSCDVYSLTSDYSYYHYCIDGLNDQGWGCGYRTCQTLCSWIYFCYRRSSEQISVQGGISGPVPSIREIQQSLVQIGDKPRSFANSKEWIGSVEIAMCLDTIYNVPCRILHIPCGEIHNHIDTICKHFKEFGGPLMLGGDCDNSSKCVVGIAVDPKLRTSYLLIVDPHCGSQVPCAEELYKLKYVSWLPVEKLDDKSFYNLCMPTLQCPS